MTSTSSSSSSSSSPPRHHTTTKDDRSPFFDTMVKKLCWSKADTVPGRDPDRWRKDAAGNTVFKPYCGCQGALCYEYDHIVPYSKGGESVIENCQILRTSTSLSSSSPSRHHTTTKDDRPPFFDSMVKKLCWSKAETVPGRDPDWWRKDAAGNTVFKPYCGCQGTLCYEYDHIVPYSKGGESVIENCQILQTRANRFKSDKDDVDTARLRGYSCDINFTGVESVIENCQILQRRRVKWFNWFKSDKDDVNHTRFSDHELDGIEIGYGNVIRPEYECRCRSIDEFLEKYKPKD